MGGIKGSWGGWVGSGISTAKHMMFPRYYNKLRLLREKAADVTVSLQEQTEQNVSDWKYSKLLNMENVLFFYRFD